MLKISLSPPPPRPGIKPSPEFEIQPPALLFPRFPLCDLPFLFLTSYRKALLVLKELQKSGKIEIVPQKEARIRKNIRLKQT